VRVLNLVPNSDSRFFQQQVAVLGERGVDQTTLTVPGRRDYEDGETSGRSPLAYARLYPSVLGASFDDYDLVHANYGLTAPHAVLQPNLPVVVSLWGTDLFGKYGWVSKLCTRLADEVVVMSPAMAAELDTDAHVIPHGVDLARFQPAPQDDAKNRLGWRDDVYHVLFPYPPERSVKDYPRADRIVDTVDGELDAPVVLHTVTGVPHDQMPTYMNAADVLLVTSRREGSPNAVKEALACNLPVVSTDVGDVDARLDGVTHSHVCTSEAGLAAAVREVLRANERSNGRQAAREISVERTSERLHGVYETVVDAA